MKARISGAESGFTLLEILFAVSILTLLGALATVSFRPFGRRVDIQTATSQVIATLHQARDRTVGSEGARSFGVHFENDRYVLFAGTTYNPSDSSNEVHRLKPNVEISAISLTGGSAVVFDRIEGSTSNSGSITLRNKHTQTDAVTVSILPSGQASLSGNPAPTDSRIVDTRHVHFDLSWSLQGGGTMKLTFSDAGGDVEEVVNMADYFNADQTEFDWNSSVSVGGQDQKMRIHTHQLDATSTLLSIHRDRRENTKAVVIEIDDQEIVSYAADGTATAGPFGGTMEVQ